MEKMKRVVPIFLAALILLGSLAGMLTMIVWGEEPDTTQPDDSQTGDEGYGTLNAGIVGYTVSDNSIQKGDTFTLTVTIIDPNIEVLSDDLDAIAAQISQAYAVLAGDSFVMSSRNVTIQPQQPISNRFTYQLTFEKLKYTGEGKSVQFRVGMNYASKPITEQTLSLTLTEAVPYEEPVEQPSEDPVKMDSATPYVIVKQYNYGGSQIAAGQTFPLTLSFYNTSEEIKIENLVMTLATSEAFTLTSSSNTSYIEELAPRKLISQSFQVQALPTAPATPQTITVTFRYQYIDNGVRKDGETSEEISIPIYQVDRFHVDPPQELPVLYVGSEDYLTITYVNQGKSTIYNIAATIEGENLVTPGQKQYLENVDAGGNGSVEFALSPLQAGEVTGEVVITYEDANANQKEVRVPYSTVAEDYTGGDIGVIDPMPMPEPEEPVEEGMPLWLILTLIGAGLAVVVVVVVVIKKKRANGSLIDDEDI